MKKPRLHARLHARLLVLCVLCSSALAFRLQTPALATPALRGARAPVPVLEAEEPAEEEGPEAAAAAAAEKAARAAYIDQVNKEQTEGTKGIVGKVVALVITGGSFAFLLYVFDPNVCAFLAPVKDACIVAPPS
jgi:hypothetical protein